MGTARARTGAGEWRCGTSAGGGMRPAPVPAWRSVRGEQSAAGGGSAFALRESERMKSSASASYEGFRGASGSAPVPPSRGGRRSVGRRAVWVPGTLGHREPAGGAGPAAEGVDGAEAPAWCGAGAAALSGSGTTKPSAVRCGSGASPARRLPWRWPRRCSRSRPCVCACQWLLPGDAAAAGVVAAVLLGSLGTKWGPSLSIGFICSACACDSGPCSSGAERKKGGVVVVVAVAVMGNTEGLKNEGCRWIGVVDASLRSVAKKKKNPEK